MANKLSYKERKEAFVSNHNGGTALEVMLLTLVPNVSRSERPALCNPLMFSLDSYQYFFGPFYSRAFVISRLIPCPHA
jgi:hypothetical protein